MADCLPECTTLQRTEMVQVSIIAARVYAIVLAQHQRSIFRKEKYCCEMVYFSTITIFVLFWLLSIMTRLTRHS
jgi:hypothetical protein